VDLGKREEGLREEESRLAGAKSRPLFHFQKGAFSRGGKKGFGLRRSRRKGGGGPKVSSTKIQIQGKGEKRGKAPFAREVFYYRKGKEATPAYRTKSFQGRLSIPREQEEEKGGGQLLFQRGGGAANEEILVMQEKEIIHWAHNL